MTNDRQMTNKLTTLLKTARALHSVLSQNGLQLANTHFLRIRNLGLLSLLRAVLDRAELGVLLVQLTDANILGRHSEGHGARHLSLNGVQVVALEVMLSGFHILQSSSARRQSSSGCSTWRSWFQQSPCPCAPPPSWKPPLQKQHQYTLQK